MKAINYKLVCLLMIAAQVSVFSSFTGIDKNKGNFSFPYKSAGLTKRQAAAHLLSRFTFGARAGEVDEVTNVGLEKWFQQQLNEDLPDDELNKMLSNYNALQLSNTEVVNTFPGQAQILRMAVKDGLIDKDSVNNSNKRQYKLILADYMQQKRLRPEKELFRQFENQKVLRAAFSNNQLKEVLTDFWFNHFNVSITKNDCAEYIPAYERDVIRPNVLGKFEDLLLATAKSPAMLFYLDNFTSTGLNVKMDDKGNNDFSNANKNDFAKNTSDSLIVRNVNKTKKASKTAGLNENYAREVMELHTLGVDGGYTQQDVTEAARALTGWTIYPMSDYGAGNAIRKVIDRVGEQNLEQRGFVRDGDFLFTPNRHDNLQKTILGKTYPAGGGYEEGVDLLKTLAHHPSTARFICTKLAVRFVSDNAPTSLINEMSKTFLQKNGDIKQVLITMVSSPQFWTKDVIRAKTKSPFELTISAVRSLDAKIDMPNQLYNWTDKMGQKIYFYQAPTGFPDKGQYWINTGALLNRMNFGLALASQRIAGVSIDLLALNNGHEPESAEAALATYSKIMMPERNLDETIRRLTPLLHDPELDKKVNEAAGKTAVTSQNKVLPNMKGTATDVMETKSTESETEQNNAAAIKKAIENKNMLYQVVGIIIGSPEFQRR